MADVENVIIVGSGPAGYTAALYTARADLRPLVIEGFALQQTTEVENYPGYREGGVSYCATCDAAFFKEHETIIVGGGDSAMEEAIFLVKFAGRVAIVNRRDEFRASAIMLDRARASGNIEWLTPYVVDEFVAGEGDAMERVRLRNAETGELLEHHATGAFIAVGHEPQSQLVTGQVRLDDNGYVQTEGLSTRTNLSGVFAAGDLVDHTYRQAITAAGSGCKAALDAEWYLRDAA